MLSLFTFNTFIFTVTVELCYISLYSRPPCSRRVHTSLYKQCSGGRGPAHSLGGTVVMNGCQGLALPADGWGGCMLMAYCFKALACCNLQRCKSLSPRNPINLSQPENAVRNKKSGGPGGRWEEGCWVI